MVNSGLSVQWQYEDCHTAALFLPPSERVGGKGIRFSRRLKLKVQKWGFQFICMSFCFSIII